jgi:hypothetical protein
MAVLSLVFGLIAWVVCPFIGAVLAIIFGHVARSQIKQSGEGGGGLAMAGLILGYVHLVAAVLFVIFWIALLGGMAILMTAFPTPSPSPG